MAKNGCHSRQSQYAIPTQKRTRGTVIKVPCYFCELFGHFIKYSSYKMIESSQGTFNWLPYANINIKIATYMYCAFRGKPAMKTYQHYMDIINKLMVTYPMIGEFQPTNSCIKIRHIWVFPCNGISPSNLYFSTYGTQMVPALQNRHGHRNKFEELY